MGWEAWLLQAAEAGASDVLFASGQVPFCHVQGYWQPLADVGAVSVGLLEAWVEGMTGVKSWHGGGMAPDEQYVVVRPWASSSRRMRVTVRGEARGLAVAVRIIPAEVPPLAALQAPPMLESLLLQGSGLILLGGQAASGRSTLLAAAVDHINASAARRIVYFGTPPEFAFEPKQSTILSLDPRVGGRGVAKTLHSLRFHDLDTVAVDAPLSGEDVNELLACAEAGLLVIAVESGTTSKSVLRTLVERLPGDRRRLARGQLAEVFRAAFTQVLVKRSDGQGLMPALEILLQTRPLAEPLREGRWDALPKILVTGRQHGMRSVDDSLDEYLRQGWIPGPEAFQKAVDKTRFQSFAPPEWAAAGG